MSKPDKALEPYEIEKIEVNLKWKGNKQKLLVAQRGKKSFIHLKERDTEYKKPNPNLIFICHLGNSKVYYNRESCEFWLMSKTHGNEVIWQQLEDHDIETLGAIFILTKYQFESSSVKRDFWIGKRLKRKIEVLNDRFHQKKPRKRR